MPDHFRDTEGRLCTLDKKSGELIPVNIISTPIKNYNAFNGGWLAMSQPALKDFVTNTKFTLTDYRVFLSICAHLDYENYLLVKQSEIAAEIGIAKTHFNRSLKKLVAEGVLENGTKVGRFNTYRLCSHIGWKGSAKNHKAEFKKKAEEATEKAKSQSPHLSVVK